MTFARLRFLTAITTIAGGILLGLGAVIFDAGTERWLGLGVGSGLAILGIGASMLTGQGLVQRILDGLLVPISLWALISARTIQLPGHGASDHLVKWLGLSAGGGIFVIGVLALIAHEVSVEADLRWALQQLSEGVTAVPVAEAHPEPEPEASAEPEPEPHAQAEPDPEPEVAESEPEAPADPEPGAGAPANPEPEVEAEAPADPEPEPAAHPEPEPQPEPVAESNGHHSVSGNGGTWLTPIEDASGDDVEASQGAQA